MDISGFSYLLIYLQLLLDYAFFVGVLFPPRGRNSFLKSKKKKKKEKTCKNTNIHIVYNQTYTVSMTLKFHEGMAVREKCLKKAS